MSFIKYYGGNPPASINEHVYYEDPEHSCFQGKHETWVSQCTRWDDEGVSRSEWNRRYYEHILKAPYDGMRNVGGIGVIEDDQIRPFDRVISAEEYAKLKDAILSSNEAYRIRLANSLAKENDPDRRANREHEHLSWRTRVWLDSYTELTHHVPYRVDDSCYAYARVRQYLPNGMTRQLMDVYHRCERDIGEAIYDGLERAERFADLLALAGFGAASISQVVGTSPSSCREGMPFEVATLQALIVNTSVAVDPEVLENARVGDADHLPLRHLREGLSAKLPTASLASFWNSLERQADDQARESGTKREVTCQACGDKREVGWNIKKHFEKMYDDARVEADFDKQRSLRGRVQHGDAIYRASSPSELLVEINRLQMTAMVSVSKRTGLLPETAEYLMTGIPVTIFDCVINGGNCRVDVRSFNVGSVSSILPMRASRNRGRVFRVGQSLPPEIDPLVLPPIERPAGAR